jgi:hypothetical protein
MRLSTEIPGQRSGLRRVSGRNWSCTLHPLEAVIDDSKAAGGLEVQAERNFDFVPVLVRRTE